MRRPSIKETAFKCPHCEAYTTQYWFRLYAGQYDEESPLRWVPTADDLERMENDENLPEEAKQHWQNWCRRMMTGLVFLVDRDDKYPGHNVHNLYLSKCYNCKKLAVWVHDNLVFPSEKQGTQPNQDLPDDIVQDIEEARDRGITESCGWRA